MVVKKLDKKLDKKLEKVFEKDSSLDVGYTDNRRCVCACGMDVHK